MNGESHLRVRRLGDPQGAFVSIKVDREDRPDVDKVYMTFIQVRGVTPITYFLMISTCVMVLIISN